jgi:hypothetical protein
LAVSHAKSHLRAPPFCGEGIYPRWAAKQPQIPNP